MQSSRRHWIRQSSLALAGLGFASELLAKEIKPFSPVTKQILLNSNENAYGPSPMARKAMMEAYLSSNRYPDDVISPLKKKIAAHWNVGAENILLGAGSSEIIGLATHHVSANKGHVLVGEPAYKVWNGQAEAFGLSFNRIALTDKKVHDLNKMLGSVTGETRMVYICNPNNPTGTVNDVNELRSFAEEASKKTMVFIDEAYTEYAQLPSLADMAVKNKNIIVAKTFSKIYGLAGARIGYAIAHTDMINTLGSYQPWSDSAVSVVSVAAASASLDDKTFTEQCRLNAAKARDICYNTFNQLKLEYIPSQTNFILFHIDSIQKDLIKEMAAQNIYVQYRPHFGGKWCRVSMGTVEEMQQFCEALKTIA
ncbi:MAG: histidinol-phosphate aminotransferase family protein [Sphingobacteriales bacterium]|nr:histidinol-phosphate aminotransferase family protein [Sphingobacteriales bacterium]